MRRLSPSTKFLYLIPQFEQKLTVIIDIHLMNTVLVDRRFPSNQTIQIVQGDITIEEVDAIVNAANALEKDEDLSFQFIQIGSDPAAAKFLQHLDNELTGKAKFDVVNTLSREDAESLTFGQMLYRAIND